MGALGQYRALDTQAFLIITDIYLIIISIYTYIILLFCYSFMNLQYLSFSNKKRPVFNTDAYRTINKGRVALDFNEKGFIVGIELIGTPLQNIYCLTLGKTNGELWFSSDKIAIVYFEDNTIVNNLKIILEKIGCFLMEKYVDLSSEQWQALDAGEKDLDKLTELFKEDIDSLPVKTMKR